MGQIVIDIPNRKNRRYVFTDAKRADDLMLALDESATRVKSLPPKLTQQQIEDDRDYKAAQKNLEEMLRTGISYSVEELREELGLA